MDKYLIILKSFINLIVIHNNLNKIQKN